MLDGEFLYVCIYIYIFFLLLRRDRWDTETMCTTLYDT
jgi:hypothetical protein